MLTLVSNNSHEINETLQKHNARNMEAGVNLNATKMKVMRSVPGHPQADAVDLQETSSYASKFRSSLHRHMFFSARNNSPSHVQHAGLHRVHQRKHNLLGGKCCSPWWQHVDAAYHQVVFLKKENLPTPLRPAKWSFSTLHSTQRRWQTMCRRLVAFKGNKREVFADKSSHGITMTKKIPSALRLYHNESRSSACQVKQQRTTDLVRSVIGNQNCLERAMWCGVICNTAPTL